MEVKKINNRAITECKIDSIDKYLIQNQANINPFTLIKDDDNINKNKIHIHNLIDDK